jgi:spore coat protein A
MTLTRRQLLRLAGGAAITLPFMSLGATCHGASSGSTGQRLPGRAKLPARFAVALPIPPVLKPIRTDGSTDYYEISQKPATAQILPGYTTPIWGYNGIFPGPTIESRRGRRVVVRHRNELPVPVVVHLHGGVTPPEHDGYPTDLLLPVDGWTGGHQHHGSSGQVSQGVREYAYPLDQPAATLWYHDHRMDFTGPQVYRGLAGFHLVHDDQEDALPLPRGERDIPLMICDRSFEEDGSFRYPSIDPTLRERPGVQEQYAEGVLGDVILVNGVAWPSLEVTNTRYRFRILNASNARRYRLALDPPPRQGPAFIQVGSDVGLLPEPANHDQLDIAQGERFDVVVDFSSYPIGTQITLANHLGDGPTSQVMRMQVTGRAHDDSAVPDRLVEFEPLDRGAAQVTRHFTFDQRRDGWAINGRTFDPNRDDAEPRLGSTEIWHLDTDVHHPVHLHLAHFQVLSRGGRQPGPYDAGWKDTIDLRGEAEIITRFTGYRGRYVFHCHNLEHEDMAMMANFRVG